MVTPVQQITTEDVPSLLTLRELTLFTLIPFDSSISSSNAEDCFIVPASSDNSVQQALNLSKYNNDLKDILKLFRHSMFYEWPKLTIPEVCFLFSKEGGEEKDKEFYSNRIMFKQLHGNPKPDKEKYMYRPVASVKDVEKDLEQALEKLHKCPGYTRQKTKIDNKSKNFTLASEKLVVELDAIIYETIEEQLNYEDESSETLFKKITEALTVPEGSGDQLNNASSSPSSYMNLINAVQKVCPKKITEALTVPEDSGDQPNNASSSPSRYMNLINAVQKVCPIRIQFLDKSSLLALIGRSFAIHRMSNRSKESKRHYNVQYLRDSWTIAPSDDSKALLTRILGSEDDFTLACKIETMGPVLTKALHYDSNVSFWRKCERLEKKNENILTDSIDSTFLTDKMVSVNMAKNVTHHMIEDWKPYLETVTSYYFLHMSQKPVEFAVLNELFLDHLKDHAKYYQGKKGNASKFYGSKRTERKKNPNKYLLQGLSSIFLELLDFPKYKKDTIFISPDEWRGLLRNTKQKRRSYKYIEDFADDSLNDEGEEKDDKHSLHKGDFDLYAKHEDVMMSSFGKIPLFTDEASEFQKLHSKFFKVFEIGNHHAEEMIFITRFSSVNPEVLCTLLPSIKGKEEIQTMQLLNNVYRACFVTFMKFSEICGPGDGENDEKIKRRKWDAAFCSRVINNLPIWIVGYHKEYMKSDGAFRKNMDTLEENMKKCKARFVFEDNQKKIKNMKFKFHNDIKNLNPDFSFELLHKHMWSIYYNLHPATDNLLDDDGKKKLWEYFVSAKHPNPLLEMVRKVEQEATRCLDGVESFSTGGETPVLIDGHILGLLETRGKRKKASGSHTPQQNKKQKKGSGSSRNTYILDEADDADSNSSHSEPNTPESSVESSNGLQDTPVSFHEANHSNRLLDAELIQQRYAIEAEAAQREEERLKELCKAKSKEEIIGDFIHEISEKLVDENKDVKGNAKERLRKLIQDWLKTISDKAPVQTGLTNFLNTKSKSKTSEPKEKQKPLTFVNRNEMSDQEIQKLNERKRRAAEELSGF